MSKAENSKEDDAQVARLVRCVTGSHNAFLTVPLDQTAALATLGPIYRRVLQTYKQLQTDPLVVGELWSEHCALAASSVEEPWNTWVVTNLLYRVFDKADVTEATLVGLGDIEAALPFYADDETVTFCVDSVLKRLVACMLSMNLGCPQGVGGETQAPT